MIPSSRQFTASPVLIWGLLGLTVVAITIPIIGIQKFAPTQTPPTVASPGVPDQLRVAALGRIEPVSGVIQVGGPVGEIVGQLLIKEGDWVTQGQVLGYLRSYQERQEELAKAKQDLDSARVRLAAETQYSEAQLQERTIDATQAPGSLESTIAAQQAQIESLRSEQSLATKQLSRYESLVAQGAAPRRELDERQAQVDQLGQRIRQAEETLQKIIKDRDRELANIQAQVTIARTNTARIQSNSQVAAAEQAIALAQVRLDNTIIKAPRQGRILRIVTKPGESIGDDGRGKGTLVTLADTSAMQVLAEVNESNIRQVKLGQVATITSRNKAFEESLKGQVSEIGRQIFKNNVLNDDPSALSDARVIQVKVQLDDSQAVAKFTNLQVDVQIEIQPTP